MSRYALVIGVSEYQSSCLDKLPKAVIDAEEVAKVLETHGNFQVERLPQRWNKETNRWEVVKKQVTNAEVIKKLKTLLWERAANSEVLIYFAGHGIRAFDELDESRGFLAVSDCLVELEGDKVVGQKNGIALDILNRLIKNEKCKLSRLVMLLDCCHSGSLLENQEVRETLTIFGSKTDYYLIAGCRSFEKARAFKGEANSIFTGALLKGLSSENANSNGEVTVDLVFNFINNELKDSGQEPIRMGSGRSITLVKYSQPQVSKSSLLKKLSSLDQNERLNAAQTLDAHPCKEVVTFLLEILKIEPNPQVQSLIASALGKVGGEEVKHELTKLLHNPKLLRNYSSLSSIILQKALTLAEKSEQQISK